MILTVHEITFLELHSPIKITRLGLEWSQHVTSLIQIDSLVIVVIEVFYFDFAGFNIQHFSPGPSGFIGQVTNLKNINKVIFFKILNPLFISLFDKLMCKTLC